MTHSRSSRQFVTMFAVLQLCVLAPAAHARGPGTEKPAARATAGAAEAEATSGAAASALASSLVSPHNADLLAQLGPALSNESRQTLAADLARNHAALEERLATIAGNEHGEQLRNARKSGDVELDAASHAKIEDAVALDRQHDEVVARMKARQAESEILARAAKEVKNQEVRAVGNVGVGLRTLAGAGAGGAAVVGGAAYLFGGRAPASSTDAKVKPLAAESVQAPNRERTANAESGQ